MWIKKENHREFFERLGKELGLNKLDDWYNLQKNVVQEHGGTGLLKCYDNSLCTVSAHPFLPLRTDRRWSLYIQNTSGFHGCLLMRVFAQAFGSPTKIKGSCNPTGFDSGREFLIGWERN